jgi:environmental stress-induced protein Ves
MTWQTVCLDNVNSTPWRNAGGKTRELLAWPNAAAWQCRASVAEVVRSGPFSSFPGVQRWFSVLEGDGICLKINGHVHMLRKGDEPLAFDGAMSTHCELMGNATQDFNLMVRSGTSARMLRVDGSFQLVTLNPKIIAVYAHKERATVQVGSTSYELLPHQFGWIHAGVNIDIHVRGSDALLMEIGV